MRAPLHPCSRSPNILRLATAARTRSSGARPRAPKKPARVLFHGPSFSAGLLAGALAVLAGAYAPEFLEDPAAAPAKAAGKDTPGLRFEFHDMLASSTVDADESVYQPPPRPGTEPAGDDATQPTNPLLIQAASFRDLDDAEALRAQLLLEDLPASMARVELASGTWYRVTVGPFASRAEADRAMARLREQKLDAVFI